MSGRVAWLLVLLSTACHKSQSSPQAALPVARHSSSIAISVDGSHVYVVNADSDSVSILNTATRQLEKEILLTGAAPAVDAGGRYTPAALPRALALSPLRNRLYVSGERSSTLYTIDLATNTIVQRTEVGSEPAGVLMSPDETNVYVACSNDEQVVRVDAATGQVAAKVKTAAKPWGLGWTSDAGALLVTHLLGPGVSALDPATLAVRATWTVPDVPVRSDPRLAYGQVRGLYDVVARPGTNEVWMPHLLLANETAQPTLDFETTVFPALAVLHTDGAFVAHLSTDALGVPGIDGAYGDVSSGPHAVEFTADGRYALVVNTSSEDILVVDATNRVESSLLRPLPGHMPEGIVLSPDGTRAYIDERNSGDVAVLRVDTSGAAPKLSVDGDVISRFTRDPMPSNMRLGQHLFFLANSDELPITRNHWVACASCHIEGRSDGVIWRFVEGPRDTPSNAGGTLDTGFLQHTGARRTVQDYWRVINVEQGGKFTPDDPGQAAQLDALAAFVNQALPVPIPPHTDAALAARGKALFERTDVGCTSCHSGPALTDSGSGNPGLDLAGPVLLHDVGTCNQGGVFPDVAHTDDDEHPRDACQFDTSALRGLADSPPYFHDGSAATLHDALEHTRGKMGHIEQLSDDDVGALVEYLRSL